jgi:hypothetical protein
MQAEPVRSGWILTASVAAGVLALSLASSPAVALPPVTDIDFALAPVLGAELLEQQHQAELVAITEAIAGPELFVLEATGRKLWPEQIWRSEARMLDFLVRIDF